MLYLNDDSEIVELLTSNFQLRSKLSAIASNANQSSTDELIKALREKHAKKQGTTGIVINPSWTRERPYLTRDFIMIPKAEEPVSTKKQHLTNDCSSVTYIVQGLIDSER